MKKLFIITDVHGHYTVLKKALEKAGFRRNCDEHLLISCGDLFDRGNENFQVLKLLDSIDNKVMIMGNHEEMLLKVLDNGYLLYHNFLNGTNQTISDIFGKNALSPDGSIDFSGKSRTVDRLSGFIKESVNYYETKNYVFVHGWLPCRKGDLSVPDNWRNAPGELWYNSRWTKFIDAYRNTPPLADKTLVCGHCSVSYAFHFDGNRTPLTHDTFFGNGLIALDACTSESQKINLLVIEDELL